jgi:hypothetical protein
VVKFDEKPRSVTRSMSMVNELQQAKAKRAQTPVLRKRFEDLKSGNKVKRTLREKRRK